MTQPTGHRPRPEQRLHPVGAERGSWLMGALYSVAFYIAMSLVMTLGEGFGGALAWGSVLVAAAWSVTALVLTARPTSRNTGLGMLASVAIILVVFWAIGGILSLTFGG